MTSLLQRPVEVPPAPLTGSSRSGFRTDVQGLRAVAVLLVVLCHAGVPGLAGGFVGVDVFFVISGFVITGALLREASRTGRVSLLSFWARRVRRLLPPAVLVVVATLAAVRVWGPPLQLREWSLDGLLTLGYGINYRLAAEGVQYQDAQVAPSPFQHFWSLAVEEQFYLAWPVLVVLVVLVARHRHRFAVGVVLLGAVGASLWASVVVTAAGSPFAYFGLHTRAWELGTGALLAVAAPLLARTPGWLATVGTWAGLCAVLVAATRFDASTPFPGTAALLPVLGAAAVVGLGTRSTPLGARRLLDLRAAQALGAVSYSWYLWHWPALVLFPYALGRPLSTLESVEVVGLSLWVAVLAWFAVETPALRSRVRLRRWYGRGLLLSAVGAAAAGLVLLTVPGTTRGPTVPSLLAERPTSTTQLQELLTRAAGVTVVPRNLTPSLGTAEQDVPASSGTDCNAGFTDVTQGACVYGDPAGTRTVALVGDSHAQQWLPAYDTAARAQGWRVVSWTKSACPYADLPIQNPQLGRAFSECDAWRAQTRERLIGLSPDLVVLSQSDSVIGRAYSDARWASATVAAARELEAAGMPVTYLLDSVYPSVDVPVCLSAHPEDSAACRAPGPQAWLEARRATLTAALRGADVPTVDPRLWTCTATACPPVVGDLLVYRDASHLSATYSAWLAALVEPQLAR